MAATHPIRDKGQLSKLVNYFLEHKEYRNYTLVILGLHTALRISDLLALRWSDVYDFDKGRVCSELELIEKKTGKHKSIELHGLIKKALNTLLVFNNITHDGYVFESRKRDNGNSRPISRVQAYRIIANASKNLEFEQLISCHSLRKTFGYHAWKSGVSPAVIMEIFNHSNFGITRRYIGIEQDDKNKVYSGLELIK